VPDSRYAKQTTPRYSSNHESKRSALSGSFGYAFGAGSLLTIVSRSSATPSPVFAETNEISSNLKSKRVCSY